MLDNGGILTLIIAAVASVLRVGWCLINSSTALPKFEAVSPGTEPKMSLTTKRPNKNSRRKGSMVGLRLTQRIWAPTAPHGRKIIWGQQHLEEALKGLALNKGVQATGVEAQGTEDIGERAQYLPCGRDLQRERLWEREEERKQWRKRMRDRWQGKGRLGKSQYFTGNSKDV